jgi:hypothetical protein
MEAKTPIFLAVPVLNLHFNVSRCALVLGLRAHIVDSEHGITADVSEPWVL